MLLAFLKPGVLTGTNGDDQYMARVRQFGDTNDPAAKIEAGIPVPCGSLAAARPPWPATWRPCSRGESGEPGLVLSTDAIRTRCLRTPTARPAGHHP